MIIVRVMGGLGNQMFQYAFAKKLQKLDKVEKYKIYLIASEYEIVLLSFLKIQLKLSPE